MLLVSQQFLSILLKFSFFSKGIDRCLCENFVSFMISEGTDCEGTAHSDFTKILLSYEERENGIRGNITGKVSQLNSTHIRLFHCLLGFHGGLTALPGDIPEASIRIAIELVLSSAHTSLCPFRKHRTCKHHCAWNVSLVDKNRAIVKQSPETIVHSMS